MSRLSRPISFSAIILGILVFTSNKYIRQSRLCRSESEATIEQSVFNENPVQFCGIGSGRMKNTKRFWPIGSAEIYSALRPNFSLELTRPGFGPPA